MSAGIEFECPHCRRVTRVAAELAGKQGRCAQCRKILEVPNPDVESSARRTSHLRQADRTGFELASSSTVEAEKLPPRPVQAPPVPELSAYELAGRSGATSMRAWDFGRVPVGVWALLALGVLFPPVPLLFGLYAVGRGHLRRSREYAVCGWAGLIEVQVIWLAVSMIQLGLFAVPLITTALTALLALVHVKWITALIRRTFVPR